MPGPARQEKKRWFMVVVVVVVAAAAVGLTLKPVPVSLSTPSMRVSFSPYKLIQRLALSIPVVKG